jgi:ubiquinone/menaquinone biosynthesis C-methylase UbiE
MVAPRFFNKVAPVYDFLTRMFMLGTYQSMRRRMLDEDTSRFSVLDLCCGTGYICNTVNAEKITGIDMSEKMLSVNAQKKRDNTTLVKANAYHMDFPAAEFDRVYCSSASHEFKLFGKVLKKCNEALKPGGKFVLFDIYQPKNLFYSLIVNTIYRYPVEHNIMWVHTLEGWRQLFEENGFTVEELEAVRGVFVYARVTKKR